MSRRERHPNSALPPYQHLRWALRRAARPGRNLRCASARRGPQGPPDTAAWGDMRHASESQVCQEAEAEAGARGRLGEPAGWAGR